jgi:DNA-binding response OmpR family regulator
MDVEPPVILVVEDDPLCRRLVSKILRTAGYRVVTAGTGPAALRRLERGGIALVLLDVMLPGLDGLEVCRRLRAAEDGEVPVPIIMLTALTSENDMHTGFLAGADDYITKPFRATELLDRVGVWLRTREWMRQEFRRYLQEAMQASARATTAELGDAMTLLRQALAEASRAGDPQARWQRLADALQIAERDLAARMAVFRRIEEHYGSLSPAAGSPAC